MTARVLTVTICVLVATVPVVATLWEHLWVWSQ